MISTTYLALFLLTILSTHSITLDHQCHVQYSKNYVCNGDFEQPSFAGGFQAFTTIPCWTTGPKTHSFQVLRNIPKLSGQCLDLNTNKNGVEEGDRYNNVVNLEKAGFYMLQLEYIANPLRDDPTKSSFEIWFDDKLVTTVHPTDKEKHKVSLRVRGRRGNNTIQLFDKSQYANTGAYVDNVGVYKISFQ